MIPKCSSLSPLLERGSDVPELACPGPAPEGLGLQGRSSWACCSKSHSVGGSPYEPPSGYCSFGGPFTVLPRTSWGKAGEKKMNLIQFGIKVATREIHKRTACLLVSLLPGVWPSFPSTLGPPQNPPCGVRAPAPPELPIRLPQACHFCCPSSPDPSLGDRPPGLKPPAPPTRPPLRAQDREYLIRSIYLKALRQ